MHHDLQLDSLQPNKMKSMIIMYTVCLPMYLGIGTLTRYSPPIKGEVLIEAIKMGWWVGGLGGEPKTVRNIYACSGVLSWSENT